MAKEIRTKKITDNGKGSRSDYPSPDKIGSRSSTVARAMASTLMPIIGATDDDRANILELSLTSDEISNLDASKKRVRELDKKPIITINLKDLRCVYCGEQATNLDHLFPFIKDKRPTGYFTEPANLVPCCGDCNQKKGAKPWYLFMGELIEAAEEDKTRNMLESRKKDLLSYCQKNNLPTSDTNQQLNTHKLVFENDVLGWWDDVYKEVVSALDNAQIQIDAFKAGIKYSIEYEENQSVEAYKILNLFDYYFKNLINSELNDIFTAEKKANQAEDTAKNAEEKAKQGTAKTIAEAKKKRKAAENAKTKAQIAKKALAAIADPTASAIVNEEIKEYFLLVGYGFRLAKDSQNRQLIQSTTNVAEKILDSARKAFQKGFACGRTSSKVIFTDCMNKGWLKEVIVPKNK